MKFPVSEFDSGFRCQRSGYTGDRPLVVRFFLVCLTVRLLGMEFCQRRYMSCIIILSGLLSQEFEC